MLAKWQAMRDPMTPEPRTAAEIEFFSHCSCCMRASLVADSEFFQDHVICLAQEIRVFVDAHHECSTFNGADGPRAKNRARFGRIVGTIDIDQGIGPVIEESF